MLLYLKMLNFEFYGDEIKLVQQNTELLVQLPFVNLNFVVIPADDDSELLVVLVRWEDER